MTNREKAEAAWGVPAPGLDREAGHGRDGKGLRKTAADLDVSPAIVSLAIRRSPREARLHRAAGEGHPRHFHHPLPSAWAYQPEGLPGQPAKTVFIHQPHSRTAFPVLPGSLPVQRNRQGGTP